MRENNYSGKSYGSHVSSGTEGNKRFFPNIGPQAVTAPKTESPKLSI
jgi:hypothetical protein